jgi:hypothetical protein
MRAGNANQGALALQKPAPEKVDSRIVAVGKKAKAKLLKGNSALSAKKPRESEEDKRILGALKKIKKSSGVRALCLADKILLQTVGANLSHWRSKVSTPGERLELAASALAEMKPANLTEAMLANQMIAVNDAALLFVLQATGAESSAEKRNDDTERACKFLALYIQQVDAMQRLKGKAGRQRVTVEHVNVHAGGQAIVGTVTARGPGEGDGEENR